MPKIILASGSPRRKELLSSFIKDFEVIVSNVKEIYPRDLELKLIPLYLSDLKAKDIYDKNPTSLVIGSDTMIIFNDKAIGKAKNKEDAKNILKSFSNNKHLVITGVTVYYKDKKYSINSINEVYFNELSDEEIEKYLLNDEYIDKAGAYAIQGKASKFINKIKGEYESIVGLPVKELKELLNTLLCN